MSQDKMKLPRPFCVVRLDRIGGAADVAADEQDAEMWAYGSEAVYTDDQLQAYGDERARVERERCAKVCEQVQRQQDNDNGAADTGGASACADAIRKGD